MAASRPALLKRHRERQSLSRSAGEDMPDEPQAETPRFLGSQVDGPKAVEELTQGSRASLVVRSRGHNVTAQQLPGFRSKRYYAGKLLRKS